MFAEFFTRFDAFAGDAWRDSSLAQPCEIETPEKITAYATELSRGLPTGGPPPSIAAFIAADIKITFPVMTDLLWTPS
ncbi:MAG: hypothetical protein LC808_20345 [Actinobacteria bacterium]|nr:hypothetical protein [Actinomycetota bacterium]